MALVCSARSKIWSVICVVGVGLALILMIGGALGWFESNPPTQVSTQRRKNFVADAGFGPIYHPESSGEGKARLLIISYLGVCCLQSIIHLNVSS